MGKYQLDEKSKAMVARYQEKAAGKGKKSKKDLQAAFLAKAKGAK